MFMYIHAYARVVPVVGIEIVGVGTSANANRARYAGGCDPHGSPHMHINRFDTCILRKVTLRVKLRVAGYITPE